MTLNFDDDEKYAKELQKEREVSFWKGIAVGAFSMLAILIFVGLTVGPH